MNRLLAVAAMAVLSACGTADAASSDDAARGSLAMSDAPPQELPTVLVYKTSTCGCCSGWVEHLREAGFNVDARDLPDNTELMRVKMDTGVPMSMATCHTALVDGYVVEGHVPADQIKRLLAERPEFAGIAVPGMPMGSPGMEGPGGRPYQVMAWDQNGEASVFAEVHPR